METELEWFQSVLQTQNRLKKCMQPHRSTKKAVRVPGLGVVLLHCLRNTPKPREEDTEPACKNMKKTDGGANVILVWMDDKTSQHCHLPTRWCCCYWGQWIQLGKEGLYTWKRDGVITIPMSYMFVFRLPYHWKRPYKNKTKQKT